MINQKTGKHSSIRANGQLKIRELPPKLEQAKDGAAQVLCPFCPIPHPILPGQEAPCGTSLKVTAVQVVIPARVARLEGLKCLKCHESGGGDMVRFRGGFVHLADCMPGTRVLAEPPALSKWAQVVYKMPERVRKQIEKRTGRAQQLKEIDPNGKETGVTLGYFFLKP